MRKSFNNRIMLFVFLVLAGIFIFAKVFLSKRSERTLNSELVDIDTSQITRILLYPGFENPDEIRFDRDVDAWMVSSGEISDEADPNSVSMMLGELINLKTDRLVARSSDKWKEYSVDDSLATRIIIKEGRKTTLDILIGRFEYPQPSSYGGYNQGYGTGYTYVRLHSTAEVFSVEGLLSMYINQPFNSWRDHSFLQLNKEQISRIEFDYPSDTGFVLQKTETFWQVDGRQADSALVAGFMNDMSRKTSSSYWDESPPETSPQFTIIIEGIDMDPVLVKAYQQISGDYILHSSHNPDSWFTSTKDGNFKDIFKPRSAFLSSLP
jgi:hypothetical protein